MNLDKQIDLRKLDQATLRKAEGMLGLNAEQCAEFQGDITRAKGRLFILVHPFYFHENDLTSSDPSLQKTLKAEKVMTRTERYIASGSVNKPPLLIFQEKNHVPERKLFRLDESSKKIYFMTTGEKTSSPHFIVKEVDGIERAGSWDDVRAVFKALGVKSILLGGTYLWDSAPFIPGVSRVVRYELQTPENAYYGCVGGARAELEKEFFVQISSLSYPISRKDFRAQKQAE